MATINVHEAKTHLSQLLARVEGGEEIVIARAGKPIARLVPVPPAQTVRAPGSWKGQLEIADDFDAPIPDAWLSPLEPER